MVSETNIFSSGPAFLASGRILALSIIAALPWPVVAQQPDQPLPAPPERRVPAFASPESAGRLGRPATGERMLSRPPMAARPPAEVAPARFEATVFEVEVPEARIVELDAKALEAKAATAQDLAKALAEFGKTKVLHKIDQTVNLYGESILLGTHEPMITGTRQMESGRGFNSVTYQEVGLVVNFAASPPPPESPRKDLNVQVNFNLSTMADSGVELSPGLKASSIRSVQFSQTGTPRFGRPSVLLNVSAASGGDNKALPTAYVVRYVLNEAKP